MYIKKEELNRIIKEEPGKVEKISVLPDRVNVKVTGGTTTVFFCSLKTDDGVRELRALVDYLKDVHKGKFMVYNRRDDNILTDFGISNMAKVFFEGGKIVNKIDLGVAKKHNRTISVEKDGGISVVPDASGEAKILDYEGVKIELDAREWPEHIQAYIPKKDDHYIEDKGLIRKVLACLANRQPVMLDGHTGVGKTKAVEQIAALLGKPLLKIQGAEDMETATLLGHLEIDKNGTYWVDGLITTAVKQGFMLYFDEINAAPAGVKIALHGLLDDQRTIVLADHHGEKIEAHEQFLFIAACNPSEHGAYIGAGDENLAFKNRFSTIHVGYLDAKTEVKLLRSLYKTIDVETIKNLVKSANMVRHLFLNDEIMGVISTRDLKAICANMRFLSVDEALSIALSKFGTEDCKSAIDCFEQHFGVLTECGKLVKS